MNSRAILNMLVSGAIVLCLVSAACAQTTAPAKTDSKNVSEKSSPVTKALKPQTTCPVQGGPINKKLFVDYKGKRIYVCCEGCIADVRKDPEMYIKKLADMGQGVKTIAPAKAPKTPKTTKKNKAAKPDTSMKGMDMGSK